VAEATMYYPSIRKRGTGENHENLQDGLCVLAEILCPVPSRYKLNLYRVSHRARTDAAVRRRDVSVVATLHRPFRHPNLFVPLAGFEPRDSLFPLPSRIVTLPEMETDRTVHKAGSLITAHYRRKAN
jgi:hypothetical protein